METYCFEVSLGRADKYAKNFEDIAEDLYSCCNDVLVSMSYDGVIVLCFERIGVSKDTVIKSAVADIRRAGYEPLMF